MNNERLKEADRISDLNKPTLQDVQKIESMLILAKKEKAGVIEISQLETYLSTSLRTYQINSIQFNSIQFNSIQ